MVSAEQQCESALCVCVCVCVYPVPLEPPSSPPTPPRRSSRSTEVRVLYSGFSPALYFTHGSSVCAHLCPALCDPMDYSQQASLSTGFSRQEYCSGLPFPPPGDLPSPGIESASLMSPTLAGEFFTTSTTWEDPKLIWGKALLP